MKWQIHADSYWSLFFFILSQYFTGVSHLSPKLYAYITLAVLKLQLYSSPGTHMTKTSHCRKWNTNSSKCQPI